MSNHHLEIVVFVLALIVLSTAFEYYLSRKRGLSREASIKESTIVGFFLSGSAFFSYLFTLVL